MKKNLFAIFALVSMHAVATPYWAAIMSNAYSGDKSPSTANAEYYTAYYFNADDAVDMFGGSTYTAVEKYLLSNYSEGVTKLQTDATELTTAQWSDLGYYTFKEYFSSAIVPDDYLAVLLYAKSEDYAYRVFGTGSAELSEDGTLAFDDASAPADTFGAWHQASIPEPTGSMLLLLGVAAMMLRRRNRR